MKKFNKLLKSLIFVGFILLMTNCNTEEIGLQNLSESSSEAKTWFEANKNNFSSNIFEYIEYFNWQGAIISNGEIGEVIEVPFTLSANLSASNKEANLYNDYHRLIFIKDKDNGFQLFYVQIFLKEGSIKDINYYNVKDNFDGKILVQELATSTGSKIEFKGGKKINRSITSRYDEEVCVYYGYWYEDGHFEALYEVGCYGSGSAPAPSPGSETPGPGYGGGGNGSDTPSESCPDGYIKKMGQCVLDKKIFDQLTGKAKCIYERLMASALFSSAIKKFDGDFSVSHLKLTINNSLPLNIYGQTQLPVNFITEVQINNNGLSNLSDLGKATVFAHEIIHAEIYRKMLSAAQIGTLMPDSSNMNIQQQVNYIDSMKDNFPGLYDYYYKRYKPTWNHEMMANHYRSTIADIIQQFDNNRLPRSIYDAVSWVGLSELDTNVTTLAWDSLSTAEKTIITNLINENFYKGPSNCN